MKQRREVRQQRDLETPVFPHRRFALGDTVTYAGRPAQVVEVVPPQGRPTVASLPVKTIRPMESYVVMMTMRDNKELFAWPDVHEVQRGK